MLKIAVSLLVFALVLTVGVQSLAHEAEGHGAAKEAGEHEKAPLFPQPTADKAKTTRPATPELLEPAYMSKITTASAALKWSSVAGADYYTVQLATDPNFKWLVVDEKMFKGTSFEAKNLQPGHHYYWRVIAGKSDNDPAYTHSQGAKSMFMTPGESNYAPQTN